MVEELWYDPHALVSEDPLCPKQHMQGELAPPFVSWKEQMPCACQEIFPRVQSGHYSG